MKSSPLTAWSGVGCVLLALTFASCSAPAGDRTADGSAQLLPIPRPDLGGAAGGVRQQIAELNASLERLLDEPDHRQRQAGAFADLGLAYLLYDFPEAA